MLLYSSDANMVQNLALDPRGNYPVDTLLQMLQSRLNLPVLRWSGTTPIESSILLVGSGQHWQAVVKGKAGTWFALDANHSSAIQNVERFLGDKLKDGAVYQVGASMDSLDASYIERVTQTRVVDESSPAQKSKRVRLSPQDPPDQDNNEDAPLQMLLDAMDSQVLFENLDGEEDPHLRPQRERKQTHLYQSDEVALLDKKCL